MVLTVEFLPYHHVSGAKDPLKNDFNNAKSDKDRILIKSKFTSAFGLAVELQYQLY